MVKTCFDAFPDYQNQVLKKLFFNVWSGSKRVFMHLRILPDHQNKVIKKFFFSPLEWLKTCFDAFADYQNQILQKLFFLRLGWLKTCFYAFPNQEIQVLKKIFLTSGVFQNLFLCICAYFQTPRIKSLKKYFFHLWSG